MHAVLSKITVGVVLLPLLCGLGCRTSSSDDVASGTILSVQYLDGDGHATGFTRVNSSKAVPGSGSWNVDATGRLTREYLIINYPKKKDLSQEVIPSSRLVFVQFGDGGIEKVDENHPNP